jgi:hypothetical protein
VIIIYSLTLFVSAFLLFWVQLWVGKLLLPLLGGAPGVWNTCMVFFQAILLLGYGYAHLLSTRLQPRYQAIAHTFFILVPLALLPLGLPLVINPPSSNNPLVWLLGILVVTVGLPSLAIATTAPLMQRWFAVVTKSSDPYFLYAASNIGSLLSLVSYPLLIETNFSLSQQSILWSGGYGILAGLIGICAIGLGGLSRDKLLLQNLSIQSPESIQKGIEEPIKPIGFIEPNETKISSIIPSKSQQFRWIILAFLPASLLLGTTTYITTDIAAVPLFWAIPLIVYLITFILAFAKNPWFNHQKLLPLLPALLTALVISFLLQVMRPIAILVPLHLLGLFIVSYISHGELAKDRPEANYLTLFYFWISVGGLCGGVFNAIASPLLFTSILEYPLILIVSFLLLPKLIDKNILDEKKPNFRFSVPISLGLILATLAIGFTPRFVWLDWLGIALGIAIWLGVYQAFSLSKIRLVVGILLFSLMGQFSLTTMGKVLVSDRSFFGVYRVVSQQQGQFYSLFHGTTLHGKQSRDSQQKLEPLTYFSRTGPIGQVFSYISSKTTTKLPDQPTHIAVLGLGVGTLASYARSGQEWTFYEIDPAVVKIATNPQYFSFLQDSLNNPNNPIKNQIILGDGRLQLARATDNYYDLLVMDAFSSDAIPTHLVTLEAIQLYFQKLKDNGIIAINISNRFINLEPVLTNLAQQLKLVSYSQIDRTITPEQKSQGKTASQWIILAKNMESLGTLTTDSHWHNSTKVDSKNNSNPTVWTDDFSDIWQVLRLNNSDHESSLEN